ncbi:hypothetical protein SDC9_109418 [bioreactor metagenome]|uniref:Uncharacterized protein n=1 Tax=bioreactor metagenome TaxID=1076179 RepID=A0A645BAR3_9ZZZZ
MDILKRTFLNGTRRIPKQLGMLCIPGLGDIRDTESAIKNLALKLKAKDDVKRIVHFICIHANGISLHLVDGLDKLLQIHRICLLREMAGKQGIVVLPEFGTLADDILPQPALRLVHPKTCPVGKARSLEHPTIGPHLVECVASLVNGGKKAVSHTRVGVARGDPNIITSYRRGERMHRDSHAASAEIKSHILENLT